MLVTAVVFWQVILAIHVVFVIGCFGVIIAYPVISAAAERLDRRSVPVLHRVRVVIGRSLINPGLVIVAIAGIYLAADLHQFKQFYVQFGIAAIVALGAIEGAYTIRSSQAMAEVAQRDVDAAAGGEVKWSDEYVTKKSRGDQIALLMAAIVVVTSFLMAVQ